MFEYRTDDGRIVSTGDEVFSHYTMSQGVIGDDMGQGWFRFVSPETGRDMLDGQRICSLDYARRMGWVKR